MAQSIMVGCDLHEKSMLLMIAVDRPSSHESGQRQDRKGHITRQGPSRVRKVLCQATWSRMGSHAETRAFFERLDAEAPKKKRIHVVAHMRKLAIRLWHAGLDAQRQAGAFDAPVRE